MTVSRRGFMAGLALTGAAALPVAYYTHRHLARLREDEEHPATPGEATLDLAATEAMRLGDRLFPTEERAVNSTFMPGEPSREVKGEIIDVPRGVTQIGQFDVVTLNRGQRDGLAEGNVLAIYKVGETVRDRVTGESVKIPDERAGLLMVFRTYKKLSYALVLMASRPLSVTDRVQNP